jgi:hypothetical protein
MASTGFAEVQPNQFLIISKKKVLSREKKAEKQPGGNEKPGASFLVVWRLGRCAALPGPGTENRGFSSGQKQAA